MTRSIWISFICVLCVIYIITKKKHKHSFGSNVQLNENYCKLKESESFFMTKWILMVHHGNGMKIYFHELLWEYLHLIQVYFVFKFPNDSKQQQKIVVRFISFYSYYFSFPFTFHNILEVGNFSFSQFIIPCTEGQFKIKII